MKNPFVKDSSAKEFTIRMRAIKRYWPAYLLDTVLSLVKKIVLMVTIVACAQMAPQLSPYLKALIASIR